MLNCPLKRGNSTLPAALWLTGLFLTLLAGGCGDTKPRLPPLAGDAVILAFGDSLTHGTGAPPRASYPAVLERLTGRRVVNAGVPGELSAQGAERLPGLLDRHRPDLLILCHGGNDILRRKPREQLAGNLRRMVRAALERGIPVVLVGVPAPGLWLDTADVYREIAREFDLPLEDAALAEIESEPSLKSDPIHPNADGYRRLAEALFGLLRESGAL